MCVWVLNNDVPIYNKLADAEVENKVGLFAFFALTTTARKRRTCGHLCRQKIAMPNFKPLGLVILEIS